MIAMISSHGSSAVGNIRSKTVTSLEPKSAA